MPTESKYKPLLFTTTMRNPERLKSFLVILAEFDGEILNNDIIEKVSKKLIKLGLYQPTKIADEIKNKWKSGRELSEEEVDNIFLENPQHHKEAGFEKGWPSRFDTWYKISKEFGLVWYNISEKITISNLGRMLIEGDQPQNELLVFTNIFAKYIRTNPFRKVLNTNKPLILLLNVITLLNNDPQFNSTGLSKIEIPLLLCWRDDNALSLYKKIKYLRTKYGFRISKEIILEECYALLSETKRDDDSILGDYPDDFIRKMRLTGLISVRGGGRYIDINTKELDAVNYILDNYSEIENFNNERQFFEYMSHVDNEVISQLTVYQQIQLTTTSELVRWRDYFGWEPIKRELLNLAENKKSTDEILKVIEQPLRLEFLTTLAIFSRFPNLEIKPNFISDDEGLPTSFAPGGQADIVCFEGDETALIEVTLLNGVQQHLRESFSIYRHLEEATIHSSKVYSVFIAPKVFIDTQRYLKYINETQNIDIRTFDISDFVTQLESYKTLNDATISSSRNLII